MITLEEIERLALDLFLIEFGKDVALLSMYSSLNSMGIVVDGMYNSYISSVTSTANLKVYMFRFITMDTAFRNY